MILKKAIMVLHQEHRLIQYPRNGGARSVARKNQNSCLSENILNIRAIFQLMVSSTAGNPSVTP
jgi:hypothetical protein